MRKLLLSVPLFLFLIFLSKITYSQAFTDVAASAGLSHCAILASDVNPTQGAAAWFDYNNDSLPDIYLTGGKHIDKLYKNNGDGTFTDKTIEAGFNILDTSIYTVGVATGDIDNDGDRDVFVTTDFRFRNYLFLNNGDGTFTDIAEAAGVADTAESASVTFGDYNKDGYLDIFVSNWCRDFEPNPVPPYPSYPNLFYINNGDNTFTNRSADFGMNNPIAASWASVFSDYDNDGDMDILTANDYGYTDNEENELFRNEYPLDNFTNLSDASGFNWGMNGMGIAVGDYNEDGYLDYYITNMFRNVLMKNNGDGTFTNMTDYAGLTRDSAIVSGTNQKVPKTSWGTAFMDYDHDTYLDIYEVSGDLFYRPPYPSLDSNMLYHNNGDGTFTNVTETMNVGDPWITRGFAMADYDNDGDLDFLVPMTDSIVGTHNVKLYKNEVANGNWLKVNTHGTVSNKDGFGARVTVVIGNRRLIREVDGGSSFASHHSSIVHFGLGNITSIDSLIIHWPSGYVNSMTNVNVNQTIDFTEVPVITSTTTKELIDFNLSPNPFKDELTVSFQLLKDEKLSISLTDVTGRKVILSTKQAYKKGKQTITLNNLPTLSSGVYMLSVNGENTHIAKKVVRE